MEWTALAFCLAASLLLLGQVLLRCRAGFDFTDEGFYLNWISDPSAFRFSVSQFGFVYHPLYRLVGGDIVLLRQCNVLVTFLLAFGLCLALLRSCCGALGPLNGAAGLVATAIAIASGSLSFFGLWLPSPNYNSLSFQAIMLAVIAMLAADRRLSGESIVAWAVLGIAGGLAFLAKPTAAAALGCATMICILAAGKFSLRGVLISVAVAALFLVVSALVIDGSLAGFVHRITGGIDLATRLSGSSQLFDLFRRDDFDMSDEHQRYLIYVGIGSFAAAVLAFRANDLARAAAASIAGLAAGLSIVAIFRLGVPEISEEPLQPVQFAVTSLSVALAALTLPLVAFRRLSRNGAAIFVFFMVLPHVYAFGTNTNYWYAAGRAGLFWLLAGVVVSAGFAGNTSAWRKLLPVAAASVLVSTGILHVAMEKPYRQAQPLGLQTTIAEIGPAKSRLLLTRDAASYLQQLHRLADDNGFTPGSPMLDLSGVSPGSLFAIGARSPGVAWTLAGYPGSNDFVAAALDLETCETIGQAWILTEPGSADSLSSDILRRVGIDITRDYQDAGSIDSRRGLVPVSFQQRLLKPARSAGVARRACEEARRANPPG